VKLQGKRFFFFFWYCIGLWNFWEPKQKARFCDNGCSGCWGGSGGGGGGDNDQWSMVSCGGGQGKHE